MNTMQVCEDEWQELSNRFVLKVSPPDYEAFLSTWKSVRQKCGDSARYKARLALIQYHLDDHQLAQKTLDSINEEDQKVEPLVEVVKILVDLALAEQSGHRDGVKILEIEKRLISYARQNPTDVAGLSLLADVSGNLGRHNFAISLYEQILTGIGGSGREWGVLRNLAITYVAAGKYNEAYDRAGHALSLNKELFIDIPFMCSVAKALASLGRIDAAQNTLTILATKREDAKENPQFRAAVHFVKSKSVTNSR